MAGNCERIITTGLIVWVTATLVPALPGQSTGPIPEPQFFAHDFPPFHHERPAVPPRSLVGPRRVSPPLLPEALRRGQYQSVQVNVDEFGNNILLDAANEPSLAVDPNDPNRMVIAWRQFDTIESSFREAGWAYSDDAGQSWSPNEPITPAFYSHAGWPQQKKIGDYYHVISDNVGADLAYAATFNDEQDIYFLRIGDYDCNRNDVGDGEDIASGSSTDFNGNGIPDECEGLADLNCDGRPDGFDIDPFALALSDPEGYAAAFPDCDINAGDMNGDGEVNAFDIDPFVQLLSGL